MEEIYSVKIVKYLDFKSGINPLFLSSIKDFVITNKDDNIDLLNNVDVVLYEKISGLNIIFTKYFNDNEEDNLNNFLDKYYDCVFLLFDYDTNKLKFYIHNITNEKNIYTLNILKYTYNLANSIILSDDSKCSKTLSYFYSINYNHRFSLMQPRKSQIRWLIAKIPEGGIRQILKSGYFIVPFTSETSEYFYNPISALDDDNLNGVNKCRFYYKNINYLDECLRIDELMRLDLKYEIENKTYNIHVATNKNKNFNNLYCYSYSELQKILYEINERECPLKFYESSIDFTDYITSSREIEKYGVDVTAKKDNYACILWGFLIPFYEKMTATSTEYYEFSFLPNIICELHTIMLDENFKIYNEYFPFPLSIIKNINIAKVQSVESALANLYTFESLKNGLKAGINIASAIATKNYTAAANQSLDLIGNVVDTSLQSNVEYDTSIENWTIRPVVMPPNDVTKLYLYRDKYPKNANVIVFIDYTNKKISCERKGI